ncbi:hypothetical protein CMU02_09120 [Elizabethkingia anophelis]|uniref:hypothetical protein n=1 Tax=Elizabethkingia anophelis TaxID=1117645 RepID=UPI00293CDEC6|nr:hypothetical protein [Elizabethkingia anophelis]MDV3904971.1 hypothetical protein [Elizabethkingia anophelis]
MKLIITPLFIAISSFCFSQNTVKYSTYKTDNTKNSYSIILDYDNQLGLNYILINVESTDPIYKNSTFIIKGTELAKFRAYLAFISVKQTEWDLINISNKTKEIIKQIDWDEEMSLNCSYSDGPIYIDTPLHTNYVFMNGNSSIDISTSRFEYTKRSRIFFLTKSFFSAFKEKIDPNKIKSFINSDYQKKSLLK